MAPWTFRSQRRTSTSKADESPFWNCSTSSSSLGAIDLVNLDARGIVAAVILYYNRIVMRAGVSYCKSPEYGACRDGCTSGSSTGGHGRVAPGWTSDQPRAATDAWRSCAGGREG